MKDWNVLIVDDDADLVSMLEMFLESKGLVVSKAHSLNEIPVNLESIDLILLDINLPRNDGFEICSRIRRKWNMPILFLSARTNEEDKIRGLMIGGDDYITKPFSLEELYARIYANIKRNENDEPQKGVSLEQGICRINGMTVELTRSEYEIVELLKRHPNQVFSKEKIYDLLWSYDSDSNPSVVSEHVRNIRNKFLKITDKDLIETKWGMGYLWIG